MTYNKVQSAIPSLNRRDLLIGAGASFAAGAASLAASANAGASVAGLRDKIYAIDARTTGGLAVSVKDKRSGRVWQYNAGMRNECASIVKVLTLVTVCYRAQAAGRDLSAWEKSQASSMIRYSDNTAASNLWNSVGGAPAAQAMANRVGMKQTVAKSAWGLTTTSAYDQMLLMNEICWEGRVLRGSYRGQIIQLMGQVSPDQRWGVGSVGTSQVKNGWLPYNGQWRINSIGHVSGGPRSYTLAIIQRTPTMGAGTNIANQVADTIYRHLATPL